MSSNAPQGETILWHRLDLPGHEIATIASTADGWLLDGVAVLAEGGRPCRIEYGIECDARWVTRRCLLGGRLGAQPVHLDVRRNASGVWSVDGVDV
ncbi:MAG TPA: putative glycolipid-binding domain-containing protein, partial [Gemmatimonadaceae bacterium]